MGGLVSQRPVRVVIRINGKPMQFPDVDASLKAGIAYLSEDRKGKGLLLTEDLRVNLTLASLDKFRRWLQIDRAKERVALDRAIGEFDIRAGRKGMLVGQLSGGHHQEPLLAQMMMTDT